MEIVIRENIKSGRRMNIPVVPEKVSFSSNGTRFITYNIMDKGDVVVPSGQNLRRVKWKSVFPGKDHYLPYASALSQGWAPKQYQTMLSEWKAYGTPLRLLITDTPIHYQNMYLYDYSIDYEGAFGDYHYTIEFIDHLDIVVTSTNLNDQNNSGQTRNVETAKTYTVVSGDNLWKIATRLLNDGQRHSEIYQLNKDAIETTAKKHGYKSSNNGWWIFPGTTLHIPA